MSRKVLIKAGVGLLLISFTSMALASHFELMGRVYPIAEDDLLLSMQEKANSPEMSDKVARLQKEKQAATKAYLDNPPAAKKLPRARTAKSHELTPSFTLTQPIVDRGGAVIFPAGYTVNPLRQIKLADPLLFFDGTDPAQVDWAEHYYQTHHHGKFILVAGSPTELMNSWQHAVYFDQESRLVDHFTIQALPAVVQQVEHHLEISEIAL